MAAASVSPNAAVRSRVGSTSSVIGNQTKHPPQTIPRALDPPLSSYSHSHLHSDPPPLPDPLQISQTAQPQYHSLSEPQPQLHAFLPPHSDLDHRHSGRNVRSGDMETGPLPAPLPLPLPLPPPAPVPVHPQPSSSFQSAVPIGFPLRSNPAPRPGKFRFVQSSRVPLLSPPLPPQPPPSKRKQGNQPTPRGNPGPDQRLPLNKSISAGKREDQFELKLQPVTEEIGLTELSIHRSANEPESQPQQQPFRELPSSPSNETHMQHQQQILHMSSLKRAILSNHPSSRRQPPLSYGQSDSEETEHDGLLSIQQKPGSLFSNWFLPFTPSRLRDEKSGESQYRGCRAAFVCAAIAVTVLCVGVAALIFAFPGSSVIRQTQLMIPKPVQSVRSYLASLYGFPIRTDVMTVAGVIEDPANPGRYSPDLTWFSLFLPDLPLLTYPINIPPIQASGHLNDESAREFAINGGNLSSSADHTHLRQFVSSTPGNEAWIYLKHIVDHYDFLPEFTVFIHGHRSSWHLKDQAWNLMNLQWSKVKERGFVNLRCDLLPVCDENAPRPGANDTVATLSPKVHLQSFLKHEWKAMFEGDMGNHIPVRVASPCCGEFVVSREAILARPRSFYEHLMWWLNDRVSVKKLIASKRVGYLLEWTWHVIFNRPADDCPTSKAQCMCESYGQCSGSGGAAA